MDVLQGNRSRQIMPVSGHGERSAIRSIVEPSDVISKVPKGYADILLEDLTGRTGGRHNQGVGQGVGRCIGRFGR